MTPSNGAWRPPGLSDQGRASLRFFVNRIVVRAGYIYPQEKEQPGWRITPEGREYLRAVPPPSEESVGLGAYVADALGLSPAREDMQPGLLEAPCPAQPASHLEESYVRISDPRGPNGCVALQRARTRSRHLEPPAPEARPAPRRAAPVARLLPGSAAKPGPGRRCDLTTYPGARSLRGRFTTGRRSSSRSARSRGGERRGASPPGVRDSAR